MSDRIEPMTHIDVRVIRQLLQTRINEGRELMKSASLSTQWKKQEQAFIGKARDALRNLDEAIKIKEGPINEASNDKVASEVNADGRKAGV